jgi:hypothetical protein
MVETTRSAKPRGRLAVLGGAPTKSPIPRPPTTYVTSSNTLLRQMLGYIDEMSGFLKVMRREHMFGARETLCSLYDGRQVGYLRAQKNGVSFAETGKKDPPQIEQYRKDLGLGTGEVLDLDDQAAQEETPAGRLVARVKKVAALLALGEAMPQRAAA